MRNFFTNPISLLLLGAIFCALLIFGSVFPADFILGQILRFSGATGLLVSALPFCVWIIWHIRAVNRHGAPVTLSEDAKASVAGNLYVAVAAVFVAAAILISG